MHYMLHTDMLVSPSSLWLCWMLCAPTTQTSLTWSSQGACSADLGMQLYLANQPCWQRLKCVHDLCWSRKPFVEAMMWHKIHSHPTHGTSMYYAAAACGLQLAVQ